MDIDLTDMFARCMACQQGDDASPLIVQPGNPVEAAYIAARMKEQEDLPLPPPDERGATEGHRDFHDVTIVTER